jgi:ABC-2 type transport system permease protein
VGGDVDAAAAVDRAGEVMHPITVESRTVGRPQPASVNQFSYTAPSNLVLFVFITSLAGGGALVESRRLGVTRRAMAAPIRTSAILLGAGTMRYAFALLQAGLILGIGALFFGVTWGPPVAVMTLIAVYALVGAGAGLLVGAVARNPEQATAIGIPAAIGMGMLGGCMWPLEVVPAPLRAVGHVVPQAWAMDGFVGLIYDGKDLSGIAVDLAVLAAYAAVLLTTATLLLRRKLTH